MSLYWLHLLLLSYAVWSCIKDKDYLSPKKMVAYIILTALYLLILFL